jgi:predicted nucleotidyltransferase
VWLFCSRTHGKHLHHGSDIDLCIRTLQTPLPSLRYSRLKSAFEDSDLPYFVDVVDWASISESFRKIIEQEYEVIWEGKPQ